ncbi:MAG: hypothetical protein COA44_15190 [Arcobacter sp.]|nr:MAG: hypothetical protein COA44_15190 [Arcobacter sp.]
MHKVRGRVIGMPSLDKANGFISDCLYKFKSTPCTIAKLLAFREDGEMLLTKEMGLTIGGLNEKDRISALLNYIKAEFKVNIGEVNDCI